MTYFTPLEHDATNASPVFWYLGDVPNMNRWQFQKEQSWGLPSDHLYFRCQATVPAKHPHRATSLCLPRLSLGPVAIRFALLDRFCYLVDVPGVGGYSAIAITVSEHAPLCFARPCLAVYALRESKGTNASSAAAPEVDEFDQMDAEEREEASSGTSHTVSWREARAYLCAVLKAR